MSITSMKTWFSILILITLAAYAVPSVMAFEQIDLYPDAWVEYGQEIVVIATYDESTDNMKIVFIYYGINFTSLSEYVSVLEETINATFYAMDVSHEEESLFEVIAYMTINEVPWMATWKSDNGYTFNRTE